MPGVLLLEIQRFVATVKLMNTTSCDLILVIGTLDFPISSSASTDMLLVMLKRWRRPVVSGVVPFAAVLALPAVLYLNPGIQLVHCNVCFLDFVRRLPRTDASASAPETM